MNYRVVFSPEAEEQLAALFRYIAAAASPQIPVPGDQRDEASPPFTHWTIKKPSASK